MKDSKPASLAGSNRNGKGKNERTLTRRELKASATEKNKPEGAIQTVNKKSRSKLASSATGSENMVCRYCGSDDLAPSFIKRRDARCRTCFKQRYGSASRAKGKTPTAA